MSGSSVNPIGPLIFDSGGLIAYIDRDVSVHRLCSRMLIENYPVILPTAVYAQVERGTAPRLMQQQRLNTLLNFCECSPLSMEIAHQVGVLLGLAGTSDVVDAVVVVEALRRESGIILTSDSGDIQHLLQASSNRQRRGIRIIRI